MLLIAPPAILAQEQPLPSKPRIIKYELTHFIPSLFSELISTPGLAPLFQEDRFISPLRPVGLDNLLSTDQDQCVIAQGTPEAQARVKALLALLDVEPKSVQLAMRLVQEGKPESRPTIVTFSNFKGKFSLEGEGDSQSVTVIPHLNRDGKMVAIAAQVNQEKWRVQTVKLGVETKFVFPNHQELFVTATQMEK